MNFKRGFSLVLSFVLVSCGEKSLQERAEAGDTEAQYELGKKYHDGDGVPENRAEAAKWYLMAAEEGLADAQYKLATIYHDEVDTLGALENKFGIGPKIDGDLIKAEKWYRLAAEQGNVDAQLSMGFLYERGIAGIPEDSEEAKKWFRLAAEKGNAIAKEQLEAIE